MASFVESRQGKLYSLGSKRVKPFQLKTALSPLAWKILLKLQEKSSYPKELSRMLKIHEQKIYYHIRNMENAGLIRVSREEITQGALTKFYSPTSLSFSLLLTEPQEIQKISSKDDKFFYPFVKHGKMNSLIVIGSPAPHGPQNVRAHDFISVTQFSLFFGSFLNSVSDTKVKIDTDVRAKDLKKNLILIGGPAVNSLTKRVNGKLAIRFKHEKNYYSGIFSTISKKSYNEENNGIIVKMKNPFDKSKFLIVIAGRRNSGTYSAVLAFLKKFDEVCKGNRVKPKVFANVVEGFDADMDGMIDAVRVLE
jgi:DNA-binding MarR family transcriptional regulator